MLRILIAELKNEFGKVVRIQGWVHRIRKLGKLAFIVVRDRSGLVQCVINTKTIDVKGLKLESVVEFIGEVQRKEGSTD